MPGAVVLLDGLGAGGADIGTGVGLGQHHGGAPAALGADGGPLLLLFGAVVVEDVGEAGAGGVHERGRVGAEDQFADGPVERPWGRQAAEFFVDAELVPAAVGQGLVRLLEGLGNGDRVGLGIEDRWVAVGLGERVGQRALCEVVHLPQHVDGGLAVEIAELTTREDLIEFQHLEEVELEVAEIALVMPHCRILCNRKTAVESGE